MNIPLMHDDQHGTAIITSAALLNALEVVGKKIDEVQAGGERGGRGGRVVPAPVPRAWA